MEHLGVIGTVF